MDVHVNTKIDFTMVTKEKIMTTTAIDAKITELFGVLNNKKPEVEAAEKASQQKWKTNCSFPSVFGNTQPINIQTQSESTLIELLSDLMIHREFQSKAALMLGAKSTAGTWGGFTIDEWVEDFKTRVAKIQLADKKKDLVQLEKRLDAIVSPEQRRALELEAITKSLGI